MDNPKKPFKAIVSGIIAGLGTAGIALADNNITNGEWVGIALATVVAFGAVYGIKNPKI